MAPPGAMWPTLPNRTAPVEFMGRSKKGRRRAFPEMAIWRERDRERESPSLTVKVDLQNAGFWGSGLADNLA